MHKRLPHTGMAIRFKLQRQHRRRRGHVHEEYALTMVWEPERLSPKQRDRETAKAQPIFKNQEVRGGQPHLHCWQTNGASSSCCCLVALTQHLKSDGQSIERVQLL
jgi:hypothetical protein